jgi:hypothetical protein
VIGWWAGFAPAARYLVPAVPLLAVPVAMALRYRAVRIALIVLLVPQAVIDAVVWQHPRWLWPAPDGNLALQSLGPLGRAYASALVNVQTESPTLAVLWIAAVATLVSAVLVWSAANERDDLGGRAVQADGFR